MQQNADSSGGGVVGRLRTSDETARVTTFELFFDLVYVFAFTQVTGLMAETHTAFGILQALIVLGLLWWTWVSYCWLANQAPADQSVMRVGMSLAMIAVFVIGLTVPEAYDDLEGGLDGPLVLTVAYTVVRLIHGVLYLVAAGDDRALRRQVLITEAVAMAPAATALLVGALIGGPAQTWIWLGAFLYDFVLTYASSRGGGAWRIYSPAHWSERHGLVVILALGESIVAIGVGVAQEAIDWAIIVGAALAVTLAILSWSAYFTRIAIAGEHELVRRTDAARVLLGMNAYTYLHFAIVAGVILGALGVEDAMAHIADAEPYGWFGASALGSGLALYIAATAVFARLVGQPWPWARIVAAGAIAAGVPLLASIRPIWALAAAVAVLAAALAAEAMLGRRRRA
ncbi:low temperature requirement protein A [Microbacterium sp.]|uniref:low temperature requirement protein A n=1 Tax=Microbacterium sp. TaxID=51671 RepID=UPI002E32C961|nr:low temperature requirement protein A [Microbacterium sp.]HEX5729451.1 low temperature requirement protein A [Microbacterium sp.]